jgi:F0F1-type ATP synthase delta subunit
MAELALANQYAKALLEVAQAAGGGQAAEAALDELSRFTEVFRSSRDLRTVLLSPVVEHQDKVRVIGRLCEAIGASRPVRNYGSNSSRRDCADSARRNRQLRESVNVAETGYR